MAMAEAVSLAFRIVAVGLSVAAAVVMGTASQPLVHSGRVVSYSDYSALVYFVVASVISAVCAALALYLSVHNADESTEELCLSVDDGTRELAISVVDAAAQALLFSGAGAALALRGVVDCGGAVAGTFCGKVGTAAAIGVCAAAAVYVAALAKASARRGR